MLEKASNLVVPFLHPIVIDGVEILLLDDISKALGFHENEALLALVMHPSMRDPANPSVDQESSIDFDESSAPNMLEYHSFKVETTLEEIVIQALVKMKESAPLVLDCSKKFVCAS